jgi:hypothetical protein
MGPYWFRLKVGSMSRTSRKPGWPRKNIWANKINANTNVVDFAPSVEEADAILAAFGYEDADALLAA